MTTMSESEPTRRDFLFVATGAVAAVGAAAALVPLIAQMNPDASTIAAGVPIEVDLTPIAVGQIIKVFDPAIHVAVDPAGLNNKALPAVRHDVLDARWVPCRRPFLVAGGELTQGAFAATKDSRARRGPRALRTYFQAELVWDDRICAALPG